MKKILAVLLTLIMVFAATGALAADITVTVNGEAVEFDRAPLLQDGAAMIPFRFVAEKLGAVVAWDGETQTVFASVGELLSTMQIGNSNIFINGDISAVANAPIIAIDRTLVSIETLEKALGATVVWDADTNTLTITK